MRTSTIGLAMTLTLVAPPALPFDQDEFCFAVTEIAHRMNARKGRWLDRSTRYDGVAVDCEAKTFEARRFLNANPDAMRQGWEAQKQRQWNAACNDDTSQENPRQRLEHHLQVNLLDRRTAVVYRTVCVNDQWPVSDQQREGTTTSRRLSAFRAIQTRLSSPISVWRRSQQSRRVARALLVRLRGGHVSSVLVIVRSGSDLADPTASKGRQLYLRIVDEMSVLADKRCCPVILLLLGRPPITVF